MMEEMAEIRKFLYKIFPYAKIKRTYHSYRFRFIVNVSIWLNDMLFYNIDGQWPIQDFNNKIFTYSVNKHLLHNYSLKFFN